MLCPKHGTFLKWVPWYRFSRMERKETNAFQNSSFYNTGRIWGYIIISYIIISCDSFLNIWHHMISHVKHIFGTNAYSIHATIHSFTMGCLSVLSLWTSYHITLGIPGLIHAQFYNSFYLPPITRPDTQGFSIRNRFIGFISFLLLSWMTLLCHCKYAFI